MSLAEDYFDRPKARSYADVARAIGVKDAAQLRAWAHEYDNRRPGQENCIALELELYGECQRVTCERIRPDLPWTRIPDPAWPNSKGRPVIDPAIRMIAERTTQAA